MTLLATDIATSIEEVLDLLAGRSPLTRVSATMPAWWHAPGP